MDRLLSLIFFCILTVSFGSPIGDEFDKSEETFELNNEINGRIVGGKPDTHNSFPYQVSLQRNKRHFCGGSILNSQWILSAGHCFQGGLKANQTVLVGTNNWMTGGQRFNINKVVVHPQFNAMALINDLSLIQIKGILTFSQIIKPIALPLNDINKENEMVIASGWGRIKANGQVPAKLQYLVSKIYNHKKCKKFNPSVKDSNICTFTKKGEGMCNGDSGGPIVAGKYQVGIVSWGFPCALGYPDVHTRVYTYVDWIKSNINEQL